MSTFKIIFQFFRVFFYFFISLSVTTFTLYVDCNEHTKITNDDIQNWKKKDIKDYTDADFERLYDQWEEADGDKLEDDELPEHKKEPPKVDLGKLDPSDPEGFIKESKRGRSLMIFVTVSGKPSEKESEKITSLWQTSLFHASFDIQRYMVSENRAIFMLKDGSQAWDIKEYLIKQERCLEVSIDGKSYPGMMASDSHNKEYEENGAIKQSQNNNHPTESSEEIGKSADRTEL